MGMLADAKALNDTELEAALNRTFAAAVAQMELLYDAQIAASLRRAASDTGTALQLARLCDGYRTTADSLDRLRGYQEVKPC
jgi:hypothetical protein